MLIISDLFFFFLRLEHGIAPVNKASHFYFPLFRISFTFSCVCLSISYKQKSIKM